MKPAKLIVRLEHLNVLLNVHQKIRTAVEIASEKTQFASIVRMLVNYGSSITKWDASSRWSFSQKSACGSIELIIVI